MVFLEPTPRRTRLVIVLIAAIIVIFAGGCPAVFDERDTISELSFAPDGKRVVFDRCRDDGCQIQVYDLETGELVAYKSPDHERWTMGRYSYDGKQITFSVIPKKPKGGLDFGAMQIAVMDADGKNYRKVTTGNGAKLYPTFSHNGKKILYTRAAHIRQKGGTPASQYDAWEVDLDWREEKQLTFNEYYYMNSLQYFSDDEHFIYYGEMPGIYDGVPFSSGKGAFSQKMNELTKEGKTIYGIVVMRGDELVPNPYVLDREKMDPKRPLLSKDGSVMIFEKGDSGDFYLYSSDGKHRLISRSGSVNSAAISADGKIFGVGFNDSAFIKKISDGTYLRAMFVRRSERWEESVQDRPYMRLLARTPSRVFSNDSN